MSGFTNVTGFAPPTSAAGFMGLLQTAMFRGVPFKVVGSSVRMGRRLATHQYPFVDGGWNEDMGRALRTYSFSGYLIGDLAPAMQLALNAAIEAPGPGLLIHPTIGAVQVNVASAGTAVHKDRMRVIEVVFEFIEHGTSGLLATIIATAVSVLAAADVALGAANSDLGSSTSAATPLGVPVIAEGQAVVSAFGASATTAGADPTAIVGIAAGLPPPAVDQTYGRYGMGAVSAPLPPGTTIASLQGQVSVQRTLLAAAVASASAAAESYSAATDMLAALAAIMEAVRAATTNPADQVRILLGIAGFSYSDGVDGTFGIGAAMATMGDAMAAACRRAALVSLARASAAYQPSSYDDAAALRVALTEALGAEITAAGDAEEDATYTALTALRAAVVQDLTARGASLPTIVTVSLNRSMPALALAQRLYKDAGRADQIVAEANPIHPAFCPAVFQALAA